MPELPKHYDHQAAQARCREIWDRGRFWHAEPPAAGAAGRAKIFSIVIPPPNVTGALHLGHALNNTLGRGRKSTRPDASGVVELSPKDRTVNGTFAGDSMVPVGR